MGKRLEFLFDVVSPATYLAWTQVRGLAARAGAEIDYRPILLGGVFQATGNQSPLMVPAKGRWIAGDFARHADRYGVRMAMPDPFPFNTLGLMRGALVAQDEDRIEAYLAAVFDAIWADGRNMSDPAEVAAVLAAAGFDAARIGTRATGDAIKDRLKRNTAEAVERGVFGAPSFFVDGEMFWGQDRLDFVEAALAA